MEILLKYFPELTEDQKSKLISLEGLYKYWNERINVISRKDIDRLYERHILHSLSIAKFISFKPDSLILDVGTGGGFPGIPLAILFPKVHFHLIDSIAKKIRVVENIVAEAGLKNVKAEQIRAENLSGKYDFIISRAVADFSDFMTFAKNKIKKQSFNKVPNGLIFLKGGELDNEIEEAGLKLKKISLKKYFSELFFETKYILYLKGF